MQLLTDLIANEIAKAAVVVPADGVMRLNVLSSGARDRGGYRIIDGNGKAVTLSIREVDPATGYAWTTGNELVKLQTPLTFAPRATRDDAKFAAKMRDVREDIKAAKEAAAQDAADGDVAREALCEKIRQRSVQTC